MSSPLTPARKDLVAQLRDAGLNAFGYWPEQITPPVVLVVPSEPWVSYGNPGDFAYGRAQLLLDVVVIAGVGTGERVLESLEDAVFDVMAALGPEALGDVSAPYETTLTGVGACLAVSIAAPVLITL